MTVNLTEYPSNQIELEVYILEIIKNYEAGNIHISDLFNASKVQLFNEDKHSLLEHQVDTVRCAILEVILSTNIHSGYCFLPTSAGKSYIIITLAGIAIGDFKLFKIIEEVYPSFLKKNENLFPFLINLSFHYSQCIPETMSFKTQILVHDKEILQQLTRDTFDRLPHKIANKISFFTVQALKNEERRVDVKYLIIDECHWGNASPEETIQSEVIAELKNNNSKAFGFTASPYENPDGKFQKTWSHNKINSDRDFNYYLDKGIIFPNLVLREVNLQNARLDYVLGQEEIELTEKKQIVDFMVRHIIQTFPGEFDAPAICFFSPIIIPDIVNELVNYKGDGVKLESYIKILGSDDAQFIEKCRLQVGNKFIADDLTIESFVKGEKIFLISQQKLLVGLNAPHLKYCFISPTNSKIRILQGIGRLMRPTDRVKEKLATLFLTSISGKKMDIGDSNDNKSNKSEGKECEKCGEIVCNCPCEKCGYPKATECMCPKNTYTTTSMTLSEAYDLKFSVFYKTEIGFRDFINQTLIDDTNTVLRIATSDIPLEDFNNWDTLEFNKKYKETRRQVLAAYRNEIFKRDNYQCQGKLLIGEEGCERDDSEVKLEIHHMEPYEFKELVKNLGFDGTLAWHSKVENWQHLVCLCINCHDLLHSKQKKLDSDKNNG